MGYIDYTVQDDTVCVQPLSRSHTAPHWCKATNQIPMGPLKVTILIEGPEGLFVHTVHSVAIASLMPG